MTAELRRHGLGWNMTDWSDFRITLVVEGSAIVLKNSRQLIQINGRPRSIPRKAARDYMLLAAEQMREQWRSVFDGPLPEGVELNAAIVTYLPTRRRPDASNLYEGPQDAMKSCTRHCKPSCRKHAGVLVDDVQIAAHDGSRRRYDKNRPRVEITLTPMTE
jgi:Holliday junction resolvase RusA-like endonuclease